MRSRIYVDLGTDGEVGDAAVIWYDEGCDVNDPEECFFPAEAALNFDAVTLFILLLDTARRQPTLPFPSGGRAQDQHFTVYGDDRETF